MALTAVRFSPSERTAYGRLQEEYRRRFEEYRAEGTAREALRIMFSRLCAECRPASAGLPEHGVSPFFSREREALVRPPLSVRLRR